VHIRAMNEMIKLLFFIHHNDEKTGLGESSTAWHVCRQFCLIFITGSTINCR